jgi:hypothetical protein
VQAGPLSEAGPRHASGLKGRQTARGKGGWAAELGWKGKGGRREKEKGFQISKSTQANEFKHSKQCTSMHATVNSYISLIN